MSERNQAIEDVAKATENSTESIQECLNATNDGTGYLLLEETAVIYAVQQRELVLKQEAELLSLRAAAKEMEKALEQVTIVCEEGDVNAVFGRVVDAMWKSAEALTAYRKAVGK